MSKLGLAVSSRRDVRLAKFLKKVNFLSICIIMAFCFLLLLNSFVFGAVTLFHVQ